jgi:hypothetical protein
MRGYSSIVQLVLLARALAAPPTQVPLQLDHNIVTQKRALHGRYLHITGTPRHERSST